MERHWVHYDRHHLIDVISGMIVSKGCDLEHIKTTDIKGYDILF